jgi:hypothetical protein
VKENAAASRFRNRRSHSGHPLQEVPLLVVRGAMADCDSIAAWGKSHLAFLRRHLRYE